MNRKDRKKKKKNHLGLFKKGNLFSPRGKKLSEHAQDTDENSSVSPARDSTSNFDDIRATGKRYNLRSQCPEETQNDFRGNRIINMGKMLENINTLIKGHSGRKCRRADLVYKTEHKHGLAMKLQFHCRKCRKCGYESQMMKMYDEIPKTTRATINTNLAVALLDTPMGISRAEVNAGQGLH